MSAKNILKHLSLFMIVLFIFGISCTTKNEETRVLVFSKTAGYRHESITSGIDAIFKLAKEHNFIADTTEDASNFNEVNLKRYKAVVFLNTTGDVLNHEQQNDFERFIQAGGGFVGIHAAADTEYDWPWYGKLVGAYFESHPRDPNVRKGTFHVVDKNHPATDSLPEVWERNDEFYSFKQINPDIKVLIKIDENTYQGGTNGDNHPMSWYHEYDGGRSFYTNMGHTHETYAEPLYLQHLWGGLQYALGGDKPAELNYKLARTVRVPEENRFTKVVLDERLEEPMELALLPDGNVLFIERRGNVKIYDQATKKTEVIATIPVNTKYLNGQEAEDGLLGVTLDPNFQKNHWIYLYYSLQGDEPKNVLTRYELNGKTLNEASAKRIIEVVVQREQCCHTGGSMAWDENGNLYLSTGDNTSPRATGYSPIDERPARYPWDAQKSSANTNDLRGKILRIHPEPDGTYTIPEGNLFPVGMEKTRPEIYGMGMRNPYRITYDRRTGYVYWGDVGPDGRIDSVGRGPMGHDEFNQARKPGNFGWPHFIGDNQAYYKRDFATNTWTGQFDPEKPINTSPYNTGLTELPPAQKAFLWYPYDKSEKFPLLGSGSRTAMAGPVFYSDDFKNAKRPFPDYYNGKLFIYEWMRGWIMAVTMNEQGDYVSMERFMPSHKFSNPMDMEFSKDGDLYILEYGTGWFTGNNDARLVRIEYTEGNRKPIVNITASKFKGAVPLAVNFSSKGTKDFDHDDLKYEWTISVKDGEKITSLSETDPSFTFEKPGVYTARLSVTDKEGNKSESSLEIQAGNEPPEVSFSITQGNTMFFFPGKSFGYSTTVTDSEDGTLNNGISPDQVSVSITHLRQGFDQVEVVQGHLTADQIAGAAPGKRLMDDSDCKSCHSVDKKSIGPTYKQIAEKYRNDQGAVERLANKVINGGSGVWGEVAMAAHPQISQDDARQIVEYILSLGSESITLPPQGSYMANMPREAAEGALILRAAYTDKGASNVPAITSEKVLILKSPQLLMGDVDQRSGANNFRMNNPPMDIISAMTNKGYISFKQIDLTDIDEIIVTNRVAANRGSVGGYLEARLDSPEGELIGTSGFMKQQQSIDRRDLQKVSMKLKPVSGLRDVYFVFRNDKVNPGENLFTLIKMDLISNAKGGRISMK